MQLIKRLFVSLCLAGGILSLNISSALAAPCNVTTNDDSGPGTLRDCLDNVATTSGDLITIPSMTIFLTSGPLQVEVPVNISGAGSDQTVIDGSQNEENSRIFEITTVNGESAYLSNLTVQGAETEDLSGAGIYVDGDGFFALRNAIVRDNEQTFTGGDQSLNGGAGIFISSGIEANIENVEVSDNVTHGLGSGAGIASHGQLEISYSLILNNRSTDADGGAGGIASYGDTAIYASTITLNQGHFGGGGFFQDLEMALTVVSENRANVDAGGLSLAGNVTVDNSSFLNNEVINGVGGGVSACGDSVEFLNVTIAGNKARDNDSPSLFNGLGGGVYNCSSFLSLINVTLFGNEADASGGGLYSSTGGDVTLLQATLAGNIADADGNNNQGNGGGLYNEAGSIQLAASILSNNQDVTGGNPDCFNAGILQTDSKNIISDPTGCDLVLGPIGSVINADAQLHLVLSDHGGLLQGWDESVPTLTLALIEGSPAIDAIEAANCSTIEDQREVSRPQGTGCDLGAFEGFIAPPPVEPDPPKPPPPSIPGASPIPSPEPTAAPGTTPTPDSGSDNPNPGTSPSYLASGGGGCSLRRASHPSSSVFLMGMAFLILSGTYAMRKKAD